MKIIISLGIIALILFGAFYLTLTLGKEEIQSTKYQGPVPQGYDLEHFRETGETKPSGVEE